MRLAGCAVDETVLVMADVARLVVDEALEWRSAATRGVVHCGYCGGDDLLGVGLSCDSGVGW